MPNVSISRRQAGLPSERAQLLFPGPTDDGICGESMRTLSTASIDVPSAGIQWLDPAAKEANVMKLMASLSLATYPEANTPKIASNAVAVAKHIGATLHAVAINVDIPDVSNALSSYLLDPVSYTHLTLPTIYSV